jgi:glycosyltransferase involved in cell wall biosynthesis
MLRIGLNAAFLGTSHNGQSTYVRGLIQALAKYTSPSTTEEYVIYTHLESAVPKVTNFRWRKTPHSICHDAGGFANLARIAWTQLGLPRLLRQDNIDVLLCPLADSPIHASTTRVVVVHDLIPLFYPEESPRLAFYFRFIVPLFLRRTDMILVDSEHTKEDVARAYRIKTERISVVHLGVDDSHFSEEGSCEAPPNCPDKYFLFVGACLQRKNPLDVIKAYASLPGCIAEKLVLVTSPGPHLQEVENTVQDLRLKEKVIIFSGLGQQQLLFLYRHATAVVVLSEYEGFGYPAAEAMAAGTPVIVSAATSLPEVVGDGGMIVRPKDLQAVANAMGALASDEGLRNSIRQRGRNRAEAFRWKVIAGNIRSRLYSTVEQQGRLSLATTN